MRKYSSLFERLKANTRLEVPDDPNSCWIWTGSVRAGYPCLAMRVKGGGRKTKPKTKSAHRLMLEEYHDIEFPFDEAGHLCNNPLCINPGHLEVQTKACNLAMRRGYIPKKSNACWIPTIFPRSEWIDNVIDYFFEHGGELATELDECPF